jgi:hypothetical protein
MVHPPVTIVIKDIGTLPQPAEIIQTAAMLLHDSKSAPKEHRGAHFNLFLGEPPVGKRLFRHCFVLCPRSGKENFRVATRIRKASRQLMSERVAGHPGIFWLGMTRFQNAQLIRSMLMRHFDEGKYPGVSQAFLIHSGIHLGTPRRTVIDYGARIVNAKSRVPLLSTFPVRPLDLLGDVLALPELGLPAYRVGAVETRVGPDMPQLQLPDLRNLDQQDLA